MRAIENVCLLLGRILMGTYFILPGLQKITAYQKMTDYMLAHGVPATDILLPMTIVIQIAAGLAIILGFKTKFAAVILPNLYFFMCVIMSFKSVTPAIEMARAYKSG